MNYFCMLLFRLEMYGRAYTWLLLGTYSSKWWTRRAPCSRRELSAALDTTILTDLLPLSTTGETTVSGIVSEFSLFILFVCVLVEVLLVVSVEETETVSSCLDSCSKYKTERFCS